MGRDCWSNRLTVEDCLSITTKWFKDQGYLKHFVRGTMSWSSHKGEKLAAVDFEVVTNSWEGYVRFKYATTDQKMGEIENFDYKVNLEPTPCNYGGRRWWFKCPLITNGVVCRNRVGVLYLVGKFFGCRKCFNLTYNSSRTHDPRASFYKKLLMKDQDI